jgi:hypothetical protein
VVSLSLQENEGARQLEQGNKPCVQEMPVLACELLIRRFEL